MKSPFASSSVYHRKQPRFIPPKVKGYRGLNIDEEFIESLYGIDNPDDEEDLEFYIADESEQYRLNSLPGLNWEYRL